MKNVKKVLLTVGSFVLTAALAIGGTVAYLQYEDSDVNVMTLGNVKIEQIEQQKNENGELEAFEQAKDFYPGTEISKIVTVKNTGKSDVYFRTLFAFEDVPESETFGVDFPLSEYGYVWSWGAPEATIVLDGATYQVYEAVYTKVLKAGETSPASLTKAELVKTATNEDMEKLGDAYDIRVLSQAVQSAGFDKAATALDTAFGDVNEANATAWFSKSAVVDTKEALEQVFNDNNEENTYTLEKDAIAVDTPIYSSISATEDVTINGNGNTVTGMVSDANEFVWSENGTVPAMSNIFSSENGEKVTVEDITFTGTMSAIMAGNYVDSSSNWFNTEFNKVNIIDAKVVSFSSGISPALAVYGKLTMNDCNVYGTTLSELDTDPMWPAYDVAAVNYSDVVINNSKIGSLYMWNQAKVTVADGSEVETIIIRGNMNATKYGLTVEAGATVDTIDLSNITNKAKVNITVNGTVGKFVANGVEYASVEAWQSAQ